MNFYILFCFSSYDFKGVMSIISLITYDLFQVVFNIIYYA